MAHRRSQIAQIDSALGRWTHALRLPPPDLAADVAAIWFGAGTMRYQRDRILPRGCAHLLINLGPTQFLVRDDDRRVAFADLWLSGTQDGYLDTEAPGGACLLGVAFHPSGAWPYLPMPQQQLRNFNGELASLLGAQAMRLHRHLLDVQDIDVRFDLVEQWLRGQRQVRHQRHPAVAQALARLRRADAPVASLARDSGLSARRLGALFEREVGLGPKTFARLQRFHRGLGLLRERDQVPWAELAALLGYADQAHMSRDIKAFSGYTPGELLARPAPDALTVVVC